MIPEQIHQLIIESKIIKNGLKKKIIIAEKKHFFLWHGI